MNFKQAQRVLSVCVDSLTPLMIEGAPGIGKSDLIRQEAEARGWKLFDIRLPLMNPTDLRGMPTVNREKRVAEWFPPAFFPQEPGAIIFLDELTTAAPMVQVAAYQLVLNRQLGEYKVPAGVPVIAAGNRGTDRSVVYEMPAPLRNRFCSITLDADFESWKSWALSKEMATEIVGYLNWKPQSLFNFDSHKTQGAFASPRSWEMTSRLIKTLEKAGQVDWDTYRDMIEGVVGKGISHEFVAFCKLKNSLPDIDKILRGEKFEFPSKPDQANACAGALVQRLSETCQKADPREMGLFIDFCRDGVPAEYCVLILRDFQQTPAYKKNTQTVVRHDSFRRTMSKYQHAILASASKK